MAKPGIPQGTRDFPAEVLYKRYYILDTIRKVFECYGFQPLETPAMENLETLMGKYGEEGDKLIFKILNNGLNDPKNSSKASQGFAKLLEGKNSTELTERALKYDLTIPFARFVAMNHSQLTFPYKRYQVQNVWRADRPQKGRYREFTQCDADVVGSTSLLNELELAHIYHDVFTKLALRKYELRINSRKILAALSTLTGGAEKLSSLTIAIDKLDKTSPERVLEELGEKGLDKQQVAIVEKYLGISGSNDDKLKAISDLFPGGEADEGIKELRYVSDHSKDINLVIDLTLARGLDYYTGIIFEAKAPAEVSMGSIGGGGRYDDLTGLFGVPGLPGVGISFGVDRIYDVMTDLDLFPAGLEVSTRVLFFNMGEVESLYAMSIMKDLRQSGIACELFHEPLKIDKQFRYAERKKIPYIIIIGSTEMENESCVVKTLETGEQVTIHVKDLQKKFTTT